MAGDFLLRIELEMDLQGRARIDARSGAARETHALQRHGRAGVPVAAEKFLAIAGKSVGLVTRCKKGDTEAEVGVP